MFVEGFDIECLVKETVGAFLRIRSDNNLSFIDFLSNENILSPQRCYYFVIIGYKPLVIALRKLLDVLQATPPSMFAEACQIIRKYPLLEYTTVIVRVFHSRGSLDNVSMNLLVFLAKDYDDANFILSKVSHRFHAWNRPYYITFAYLSNELRTTISRTLLQEKQKHIPPEIIASGEETLETLELTNQDFISDPFTYGLCESSLLRRRLKALPYLCRTIGPTAVSKLFDKQCPGCLALTLIISSTLLNDSSFVFNIICQTCDACGSNYPSQIRSVHDIEDLVKESKIRYQRKEDAYPYFANCIDFGLTSRFVNDMNSIGMEIMGRNVNWH